MRDYPTYTMNDDRRNPRNGRWVRVLFGSDDEDYEKELGGRVEGQVQVTADPAINQISFAMEDREFSIDRQLLADTISQLWAEELRCMEAFVQEQAARDPEFKAMLDNIR